MPELPEVEVILRGLKSLIGDKILYSIIRCYNLRWPVSSEIYKLKNNFILNIKRRARYLIIKLEYGNILIHLGMSGSFYLFDKTEKVIIKKHDHIDLIFSNKILRYNDPRRFGFWLWTKNLENNKFLQKLGPEPFSKKFNDNYLFQKSKFTRKNVKNWLMDNKLVVGIGNIYANEILFLSKIHPNRLTKSLNTQDCCNIVNNTKKILLESIKKGGTTIRNFSKINKKKGDFSKELKVYKRELEKCLFCHSYIKRILNNKRATFFCPKCQI